MTSRPADDRRAVTEPEPSPAPTTPASGGFGRLARDSALFALGAAVGKLVGIVLLPILTRSLSPAEFGRVDVLSTIQSAAASVLLLGMDLAVTRIYADLDDERPRLFPTWLCGVGVVAIPAALALAAGSHGVSRALFETDRYATAVTLTGIAIVGSMVQVVGLTALRNVGRAGAYAAVSGGSLVLNGVLVIALVPSHRSATSALTAMAISMVAGGVASVVVGRRLFAGRPDLDLGRRLLVLGIPLAPAVAATWVAEVANRAILLRRSSADDVAYFSVATRFSSVAVLVVLGFQLAWQPAAFALGASREALQRIADDGRRIVTGVSLAVVAVAAVAPELVRLLGGTEYAPAVRVVGLSLVFAIGYAAFQAASMPSAISRRMRDLGLSAIVAAGVGVGLNLALAPRHGAAGTGIAVAAGQFAGTALMIALARTQAPVPYAWARIALVVGVASAATIGATWPAGGASAGARAAIWLAATGAVFAEGSGTDLVRSLRTPRPRSTDQ